MEVILPQHGIVNSESARHKVLGSYDLISIGKDPKSYGRPSKLFAQTGK